MILNVVDFYFKKSWLFGREEAIIILVWIKINKLSLLSFL